MRQLKTLVYSPGGDPSAEDARYYDIVCTEDGVYGTIMEARSGYRLVSRDALKMARDLIYFLADDNRGESYCVARCDLPDMEDHLLVLKERKEVPDYLGVTILNGRACLMRDKAHDIPSMAAVATEMETEYTFLAPVSRPLPGPGVDTIKGDETPNDQRVELESPSL